MLDRTSESGHKSDSFRGALLNSLLVYQPYNTSQPFIKPSLLLYLKILRVTSRFPPTSSHPNLSAQLLATRHWPTAPPSSPSTAPHPNFTTDIVHLVSSTSLPYHSAKHRNWAASLNLLNVDAHSLMHQLRCPGGSRHDVSNYLRPCKRETQRGQSHGFATAQEK